MQIAEKGDQQFEGARARLIKKIERKNYEVGLKSAISKGGKKQNTIITQKRDPATVA